MNQLSSASSRDDTTQLVRQMLMRLLLPGSLLLASVCFYALGYRFSDVTEWLERAPQWAPCLFVGCGTIAMSLFVPKTVVSLAAGALLGTPAGCTVMFITAISAAALNYSIGKYFIGRQSGSLAGVPQQGIDATQEPASCQQEISKSWLVALAELAREAGLGLHLLIRLSPIPTTIISYSMGAAQARWRPYLAAAAIAIVPQFFYVHAASAMVDPRLSEQYRWGSSMLTLLVAITVSILLTRVARRRLLEIRAASH